MSDERRGRVRTVGTILPRVSAKVLGKRGLGEAQLAQHWAEIVGERLASATSPERLSFPRGERSEGTLRLRVTPGIALEVQHSEPALLERINGFFGYRALGRLVLSQNWVPRQPARLPARPLKPEENEALERRVASVGDESLRRSLKRFGAAILTAKRK
ncbi:MAG TPA: DciA family protein [Stellaceae bacterium]|nr:DciA family protein [Stellaceae bacterium]